MKKIEANDLETKPPDLVAENIAKLKALFPELVTEGQDGATVNVDVLKHEKSPPLPNAAYKALIVNGAEHWRLPKEYVAELKTDRGGGVIPKGRTRLAEADLPIAEVSKRGGGGAQVVLYL